MNVGEQGTTNVTCIYPGPHDVMSEEHYLPVSLGTFEGMEPLRDRVCRSCNEKLGNELEVQFTRAGPTGFFRWIVGIPGRDGLPPSPFYHGAGGTQPIFMIGRPDWAPYDLLAETDPGQRGAFACRQIIFQDVSGATHPVPVPNAMRDRPDLLRRRLQRLRLEKAKPVYVVAGADETEWMGALIQGLGGCLAGEWEVPVGEPQRIPLNAKVNVTSAYFRAIAKIVFHYTLAMFPDFTGLEREFDDIKAFIWSGGADDVDQFVRQRPDQFVEQFRRGWRPTHWMHILAVKRERRRLTGYAQFFAGPAFLPQGYEVRLGGNPARIISRLQWRAHQFVILNPTASSGPHGKMEDCEPVEHIWPFAR